MILGKKAKDDTIKLIDPESLTKNELTSIPKACEEAPQKRKKVPSIASKGFVLFLAFLSFCVICLGFAIMVWPMTQNENRSSMEPTVSNEDSDLIPRTTTSSYDTTTEEAGTDNWRGLVFLRVKIIDGGKYVLSYIGILTYKN